MWFMVRGPRAEARSQPQWMAPIHVQDQTTLHLTAVLPQWAEELLPSPSHSDRRIITIVHGEIHNSRMHIHRGAHRILSIVGVTVPTRAVPGQIHLTGTIQAHHPAPLPEAVVRWIAAAGPQGVVHLQVQDQMVDPGEEIN